MCPFEGKEWGISACCWQTLVVLSAEGACNTLSMSDVGSTQGWSCKVSSAAANAKVCWAGSITSHCDNEALLMLGVSGETVEVTPLARLHCGGGCQLLQSDSFPHSTVAWYACTSHHTYHMPEVHVKITYSQHTCGDREERRSTAWEQCSAATNLDM